jgi:uncharacterized protein YdaU (DUF1376 family)
MASSKNLWFPFYWNDYLNDTLTLDMLQHGAYLKCLLASYRSGGQLPSDLPSVFRMVGAFTIDEQKAVTFILENFFQKSDGFYNHKRVESELQNIERKRAVATASATTAAKARWDGRQRKSDARGMPDGMPDGCQTDSVRDAQRNAQGKASRAQTDRPSKHENSQNGQAVGQSGEYVSEESSLSPKSKSSVERCKEFRMSKEAQLPDEMKYAEPEDGEHEKILAQLDEIGAEYLGMAVGEWVDVQSPPISGLKFHRWKRWLETGADHFTDWKEQIESDKRRAKVKQ